jgi:hypothetical protein
VPAAARGAARRDHLLQRKIAQVGSPSKPRTWPWACRRKGGPRGS